MKFSDNIKDLAKENESFRKILATGDYSQLVIMSLAPGEDIGMETHDDVDQILYCVDGDGEAVLDQEVFPFENGTLTFVPAGTEHNFRNIGDEDLKIFTIYSPPEHPDGTVQMTKLA
ncbi:MAG TPA: cupin domain-containing protein [Candidatus Moranbacteria bacterium]|nr:cupin domain-containing protein [Candidatus Moranbacteria bacterium]